MGASDELRAVAMEDILVPKERTDAVVFIGVDKLDNVEFIKVYAVSEEAALEALEAFMNARGLHPADYRLVSRGFEETAGRRAITTRTEEKLSALASRLGLKLLSNGILHTGDVGELYQLTLLSEELYERLNAGRSLGSREKRKRGLAVSVQKALELGLPVLVVNFRGINLEPLIPEGAVLLREPSPAEVLKTMKERVVVVETVWPDKYAGLPLAVRINLPPLSKEEFTEELAERLGFSVDPGLFEDYPEWLLNYRNIDFLAEIAKKLMKEGMDEETALETAVMINLGFIPSDFEGLES